MLFDKSKGSISEHISNIFKEGELVQGSVVREFRTTASDGKSYTTKYYNLDVIISVGYRVKSKRGTQFRIWANSVLKDYLIKGYAVKNNRWVNGVPTEMGTEKNISYDRNGNLTFLQRNLDGTTDDIYFGYQGKFLLCRQRRWLCCPGICCALGRENLCRNSGWRCVGLLECVQPDTTGHQLIFPRIK